MEIPFQPILPLGKHLIEQLQSIKWSSCEEAVSILITNQAAIFAIDSASIFTTNAETWRYDGNF